MGHVGTHGRVGYRGLGTEMQLPRERNKPSWCWATSVGLLGHAGVKGVMVRFGPHLGAYFGPTQRLKMSFTLGLDPSVDRINTYIKKRIENKIKHVIKKHNKNT